MKSGSGYGAMMEKGVWTKHLKFQQVSDSLKRWKEFFETGVLHQPSVEGAPDEFLIDHRICSFWSANWR